MTPSKSVRTLVLDSFALIAYLEGEPGCEQVVELLRGAEKKKMKLLMSTINWGEVYYCLARARGLEAAEEAVRVIVQLPITLVSPDSEAVLEAARLKAQHAISFADCFAAALAQRHNGPLVTGDPDFRRLEPSLSVRWLSGPTRKPARKPTRK